MLSISLADMSKDKLLTKIVLLSLYNEILIIMFFKFALSTSSKATASLFKAFNSVFSFFGKLSFKCFSASSSSSSSSSASICFCFAFPPSLDFLKEFTEKSNWKNGGLHRNYPSIHKSFSFFQQTHFAQLCLQSRRFLFG